MSRLGNLKLAHPRYELFYVNDKKIATAEDKAKSLSGDRYTWFQWMKKMMLLNGHHKKRELIHETPVGTPVIAFINHGRWVAICPACGCAEVVEPKTPIFYCLNCTNRDNSSLPLPVKFPRSRVKIEDELLARKKRQFRNWDGKMTLTELRTETSIKFKE